MPKEVFGDSLEAPKSEQDHLDERRIRGYLLAKPQPSVTVHEVSVGTAIARR
jgi:hypothetical protein